MTLSEKIIVITGISAALLASATACVIDNPNLEQNGVFHCTCSESNAAEGKCTKDCLENSECVIPNGKTEGTCVPKTEVKRCVDDDKDGFESASQEYMNLCGFNEEHPIDCDDSNPMVYPGAAEICDGKDNDCDGCVDGTMSNGSCVPYKVPCLGVDEVPKGVCQDGGYITCKDGKEDKSQCKTEAQVGYVDDERSDEYCDGKDNDCDGCIDDECVDVAFKWCKVQETCEETKAKTPFCFYDVEQQKVVFVPSTTSTEYILVCNDGFGAETSYDSSKCPCKGTTYCENDVLTCKNVNNTDLSSPDFLSNTETSDSMDWNCDGVLPAEQQ